MVCGGLLLAAGALTTKGFFILLPNEAAVLTLFGRYTGTVKANGFWWVNPSRSSAKNLPAPWPT